VTENDLELKGKSLQCEISPRFTESAILPELEGNMFRDTMNIPLTTRDDSVILASAAKKMMFFLK
jgi:hypothetical protein